MLGSLGPMIIRTARPAPPAATHSNDEEVSLKQSEFQPCAGCGKGMMHAGAPFFYRATVSQMIVNIAAVRRQHGLEMMMGAAAPLAQVLGPDEHLAQDIATKTVLLCSDCAMTGHLPIAALIDDFDSPEAS